MVSSKMLHGIIHCQYKSLCRGGGAFRLAVSTVMSALWQLAETETGG